METPTFQPHLNGLADADGENGRQSRLERLESRSAA